MCIFVQVNRFISLCKVLCICFSLGTKLECEEKQDEMEDETDMTNKENQNPTPKRLKKSYKQVNFVIAVILQHMLKLLICMFMNYSMKVVVRKTKQKLQGKRYIFPLW